MNGGPAGDGTRPAFPYYYWNESQSYAFFRVPKILFTSGVFRNLSTDAKLLFGMLLDRMELSMKNGWYDKDGRVFIYFPLKTIMDTLDCGNKKAGQLLAELDDETGVGLISRVRQGQGKPDRIYVRKFTLPQMQTTDIRGSPCGRSQKDRDFPAFSDMSNRQVQTCQNDISGGVEMTGPEVSKAHPINTEYKKIKMSETDRVVSGLADGQTEEDPLLTDYREYREYFEDTLELESLRRDNPSRTEMIDEIREILTDACCSRKKLIRVCGDDKPAEIVRSRFMKLDRGHIQFVLDGMARNTTKVRNIKQYMLTSLYNAQITIDSHYLTEVNHDLYGTD